MYLLWHPEQWVVYVFLLLSNLPGQENAQPMRMRTIQSLFLDNITKTASMGEICEKCEVEELFPRLVFLMVGMFRMIVLGLLV